MALPSCGPSQEPILHHFYFDVNNERCVSSVLMMKIPELKDKADQYFKELCDLPLSSILDNDQGQKTCKAIGQKIFETFKNCPGAADDQGKQAMRHILNQLRHCPDGNLRAESVRLAWEGIGDNANRQKMLRFG
jgi:hypothetical protein